MIKRYNRSFIGLMEQCNTGEWCKWEEVERDSIALNNIKEFWKDEADKYYASYFKIFAKVANYRFGCIILVPSLVFNIVTIIGLIL